MSKYIFTTERFSKANRADVPLNWQLLRHFRFFLRATYLSRYTQDMELSPEEQDHCQRLTTQLLHKTLDDCEELGLGTPYTGSYEKLDKKRWKKLQSHPDVTIYADRSADAAWLPVMSRDEWENPVAVTALGRLNCSLDDVMLALATPNIAAHRLRSFLMDRRPKRNCQFVPVVKPTLESPFQFLAVTRFVNTHNWPFTMFKAPREMILVAATGEFVSASGERCGYEMVQSVVLRYHQTPMQRSRVLHARLFWEQPDGSVVVYNKFIVDVKNRLPDSIKHGALCRAVLSFWKFVPCSIATKKMWWCVKNKKKMIPDLQAHSKAQGTNEFDSTCCNAISSNSQNKQTVANRCEFCETWLCGGSKCRISCPLKMLVSCETDIYEQKLILCSRCVAFVRSRSALEIARTELMEMQRTSYGKALADWERLSFSSTSASYSSTESS